MPGVTSRKSDPSALRSATISCAEQTTPSSVDCLARRARRSTCSSAGPRWPTDSSTASSRLVNAVTPITFTCGSTARAASAASRIMRSPPEAWRLKIFAPSFASSRAAAATVFGISWNFTSAKTGRPVSTMRRTPSGPAAVMNSRPIFRPPTWGRTAVAIASARSTSGVSSATKTGFENRIWLIRARS